MRKFALMTASAGLLLALGCAGGDLQQPEQIEELAAAMAEESRDVKTVAVSITSLGLTSNKGENTKEVYVLALYTDGSEAAGARTGYRPSLGPVQDLGSFSLAASPIYRNITVDNPVSLSGSGLVLYPNLNPNGYLMVHVFVIESDDGARSIGNVMQEISGKVLEGDLASTVATGKEAFGVVTQATNLLSLILEANRDDALLEHTHAGFHFNGYGTDEGSVFEVENEKIGFELSVVVDDGSICVGDERERNCGSHEDCPEGPSTRGLVPEPVDQGAGPGPEGRDCRLGDEA
ncbi:MAG: hypothetical protein OXG83_06725 [Acidobacteria bacterium]|nr:hypothetical protein [Acidobacteriota bacterium]